MGKKHLETWPKPTKMPRPEISGRSILDSRMEQGTSDYFVLNFLPVIVGI